MKQLDPRLTKPMLMDLGGKSCILTTPEGETQFGVVARIHCDDNGKVEFFEASEVFPAEFKGEEVLVDYAQMKAPVRLYKRRKDGTFRTDKKKGEFFTAVLDEQPTKVLTYFMLAFPDEALAKISEDTAEQMREMEIRLVEEFVNQ